YLNVPSDLPACQCSGSDAAQRDNERRGATEATSLRMRDGSQLLPPAPVTDEPWPAAATSIENISGLPQGLAGRPAASWRCGRLSARHRRRSHRRRRQRPCHISKWLAENLPTRHLRILDWATA